MIPAAIWAAVLSVFDIKYRVLPNWLTLGGAGVALAVRTWTGGMPGLTEGIAAGAMAGAFLLLPFLLHGAGGGDVKMLAAAGVMCGWSRLPWMLWFMSVAGLFLVVIMLALKRADGTRLKHYVRCVLDWRYDRKAAAAKLPPRDQDRVRVPFGAAIGAGLILALWARR